MRKKGIKGVDQRQVLMIENAFYQCNPPDIQAVHRKSRSGLETYIRHLVYRTLDRKSSGEIVRTLRKLDWKNAETVEMLAKYFIKIWKIRFGNLSSMAYILSQLERYHPEFTAMIVHATLDSFKLGMEMNFFKVIVSHAKKSVRMMGFRKTKDASAYASSLESCLYSELWILIR